MGFIRPATPGFLVTLIATVLLAVVCFCVPYFKSVYFLKAIISVRDVKGSITFGTLGYCIELPSGTSCSKPSIGYQLGKLSLLDESVCSVSTRRHKQFGWQQTPGGDTSSRRQMGHLCPSPTHRRPCSFRRISCFRASCTCAGNVHDML